MKEVRLRSGREASVERRHPWIFSRALCSTEGLEEGNVVDVTDSKGRFFARGYYEVGTIAIRILTFNKSEAIDEVFWAHRLKSALLMRECMGLAKGRHEAFRLVHGEGDGLPGLIIDIYGEVAVMQAHTLSIHTRRREIAEVLRVVYPSLSAIFYKSNDTLPSHVQERVLDEVLYGDVKTIEHVVAEENGIKFYPDILRGQKTGFFLDQRLNRQRLQQLCYGRRVLNMFCYTGGFSMYALKGGARQVVSLDSSAKAIHQLERNLSLNFTDSELKAHSSVVSDAFKYLYDLEVGAFDIVILDPPAFAKRREVLKNGLQGYRKLNTEALRKMTSGSLLFTFSCSQVVSVDEFRQTLFTSALQAKRDISILQQFGQFADHPISIYHPEGEYLKGFLLYVR